MPAWLEAALWGLAAGGALIVGAAFGYTLRLPQRVIAGVMAFGAGVLISALSYELVLDAYREGGGWATVAGFSVGAAIYTLANRLLSRKGAKHRKRSGHQQPSEEQKPGSGTAIALGALLDGIPESIAIGLTMLAGNVSLATVAAISVSNVPEGLSSSAGMKNAGRTPVYVFGVWGAIALISGVSALVGYTLLGDLTAELRAGTTALAAGAILAMLMDTMIPEAFEGSQDRAGLLAAAGFLCSFGLTTLGG